MTTENAAQAIEQPTGAELLQVVMHSAYDDSHKDASRVCPGCERDCFRIGITDLAYTYRTCDCGDPEFPHLVEQLWHLACLQGRDPDIEKAVDHLAYVLEGWPEKRAKKGVAEAVLRMREALDARRQ